MTPQQIIEILDNNKSDSNGAIWPKHYHKIATEIHAEQEKEMKATTLFHTDKEIEEHIWEEISVPLSQVDLDTQSDNYIKYLNAVFWAKWGRDNCNKIKQQEGI